MVRPRYTVQQLQRLRESSLVHKPEDLPSIEQWIEYVQLSFLMRSQLTLSKNSGRSKESEDV